MNAKFEHRLKNIAISLFPTIRTLKTCHVAILCRKNRIVHVGWNKPKTHPNNARHPYRWHTPLLHAELDVCLKTHEDDLSKYTLYVMRVNRNQQFKNSKPCSGCKSLIEQLNINNVYYTNSYGEFEYLI